MSIVCSDINKSLYNSSFPSDLTFASKEISKILEKIKNELYINNDDYFDVRVIVNELLNNAVSHGNHFNREKKVSVKVFLKDKNNLYITVEDQGDGYKSNKVLQKEKNNLNFESCFNIEESGRGLLIVNSLCDKVLYNKRGNKIIVKKQLH